MAGNRRGVCRLSGSKFACFICGIQRRWDMEGGGYLLTVYNLLIWLVFLTTQIPWLGFEVKKGVSKEKNAHFLISKQGFFR
jgi:hypothetical protein